MYIPFAHIVTFFLAFHISIKNTIQLLMLHQIYVEIYFKKILMAKLNSNMISGIVGTGR